MDCYLNLKILPSRLLKTEMGKTIVFQLGSLELRNGINALIALIDETFDTLSFSKT